VDTTAKLPPATVVKVVDPPGPVASASEPASVGSLDDALDAVVRSLPGGGEERPGQREMAHAVALALDVGRHLIVQAGTGTGKSIAYLVPLVRSKQRVVVATATKALQDQLARKDLPILSEALGDRFAFAVLKGRNNYLCRQRVRELLDGLGQQRLDATSPFGEPERTASSSKEGSGQRHAVADELRRIVAWAEETETGDRADLPFEPGARSWSMVSVGPRECPGAFHCPSGSSCFAEAARARAATANVVVVNMHLYGAHLASGVPVLPEHDAVVFDEVHELEDVMTSSLGVEIPPMRFRALGILCRPLIGAEDPSVAHDVTDLGDRLQAALEGRVGTRLLAGPSGADAGLRDLLTLAASRLERLARRLSDEERRQRSLAPMTDVAGGTDGARARAQVSAAHLIEDVHRLSDPNPAEVVWVDGSRHAPVLRLSPIAVGEQLAERLWKRTTAVLTSATIPPGLAERLGIPASDVDHLVVSSPFDYRANSVLYVPRHMPDRRLAESEPALHEELEFLIRAAGGRTLALFTSWRATELAAGVLSERLPYRVLVQGELPKPLLLRRFAEEETSCLFATLGFWQGVDVPGRSLLLVTLDRLPFPRPGDPLTDARRERAGEGAFRLVDLPRAATLLAQGAGRLIRTASDCGVVAVLDSRLATASYRGVLLGVFPPMRRTHDRRLVATLLGQWSGRDRSPEATTAPADSASPRRQ